MSRKAASAFLAFWAMASPSPPDCEARHVPMGCKAQLTLPTTLDLLGSLTRPASEVESRYIAAWPCRKAVLLSPCP
ncbi:hypothetical protein D9M69_701650 [compost metagenome]